MTTKSNGYITWRIRVLSTYIKTKSNGYFTWRLCAICTINEDKRLMGTLHEDQE
jgi:hypothetical protein